jgi:NADP-dependent 3-hydroxy acid dehydrogenase YdfG
VTQTPKDDLTSSNAKTAVVTGASSGIGEATARQLRAEGFDVVIGARRKDRLAAVGEEIGARAIRLDVTDLESVESFASQVETCHVLVNNAGGALGLDPIEHGSDDDWLEMYDRNVMSVLRMSRAFIPKLVESGDGHIVNIGSVAGRHVYSGGGGYTAAKHAERAVSKTLRGELLGRPVRVTEIQPGLVETEFSVVRFGGDQARADAVYEGMTPLTADDIADCVTWICTRQSHVNVDEMVVTPRSQVLGFGQQVFREGV